MRINLLNGEVTEEHITNEIWIVPWQIAVGQTHSLTSDSSTTAFNMQDGCPEFHFQFFEYGKMAIYSYREDITNNATKKLDLLFTCLVQAQLTNHDTVTAEFEGPGTTTNVTEFNVPNTITINAENVKYLFKTIDEFAILNGIQTFRDISHESAKHKFLLYCFPLLRQIYDEHDYINLRNFETMTSIALIETNELRTHESVYDCFKQENIKEAITLAIGRCPKKMKKLVGKNLIKQSTVNRAVEVPVHYNDAARDAIQNVFVDDSETALFNTVLDFGGKKSYVHTQVNEYIFNQIRFLNELFPLDYVYRYMEEHSDLLTGPPGRNEQEVIKFLKDNFTPKKIYNMLSDVFSWNELADAAKQFNEYTADKVPPKLKNTYPNGIEISNFKTIKELHDKISVQYNKIKAADSDKTIEYTPEEFALHGHKMKNGLSFELASSSAKIIEWGGSLKHCIASYADKAVKKECLLIAVHKCGKLMYNLEVKVDYAFFKQIKERLEKGETVYSGLTKLNKEDLHSKIKPYEIKQFRGYRNCEPTVAERQIVDQGLWSAFPTPQLVQNEEEPLNELLG